MDALDFSTFAPARRDSALRFLGSLRRDVAATAVQRAAEGPRYRCEDCGGPARLHRGRVSGRWAAVGTECTHDASFYPTAADVPTSA